MPTPSQTLVRRAVEDIWNDARLEVADELFSATYVNHGGLITDLVHGPEAIKASVVLYRRAFPQLHITIDDLACVDDLTVLHWRAHNRAPDTGECQLPASITAGLPGVTRLRAASGQIHESWTEWDRDAALQRLQRIHQSGNADDPPNPA